MKLSKKQMFGIALATILLTSLGLVGFTKAFPEKSILSQSQEYMILDKLGLDSPLNTNPVDIQTFGPTKPVWGGNSQEVVITLRVACNREGCQVGKHFVPNTQ